MPANNLLLREKKGFAGSGVGRLHTRELWTERLHILELNQVQANVLGTEWVKILIDLKETNGN